MFYQASSFYARRLHHFLKMKRTRDMGMDYKVVKNPVAVIASRPTETPFNITTKKRSVKRTDSHKTKRVLIHKFEKEYTTGTTTCRSSSSLHEQFVETHKRNACQNDNATDYCWKSLNVGMKELCLDLTFPTGQTFRWKQTGPSEYTGAIGIYLFTLRQIRDEVEYLIHSPGEQSEEEERTFLNDYLNLDISLTGMWDGFVEVDSRFAALAPYMGGARLLRQDPVECLFQFICSSNNNIQRITQMVAYLSSFGLPLGTVDGTVFHEFPSLEELSSITEGQLRTAGFGYRAKYIVEAVKALKSKCGGGKQWLLSLRNLPLEESIEALCTLPGIGPKVASCIALFSLDQHYNSQPHFLLTTLNSLHSTLVRDLQKMKGGTVQITWHDSKPVLTLDFHRLTGFLATGGADHDIKFWSLHQTESKKEGSKVSYESSLAYHSSAVNVLRFAPSGEQLASGADGGELVIWKLHNADNGNSWKVLKTLSFHRKDVLDLQWSPDGAFLISGSVDNSCIIWDATKGGLQQILDTHLHYVQGVAWDPAGIYVASTSSDRTCRIYANKPQNGRAKGQEKMNYVCQHVIAKSESEKQGTTKFHLFHDETLPSFFRRLQWSPDGSFLVVPAGIHKFSPDSSASNTAYIFSRKDFSRPALQLPGASKPIVAVRFCPLVFTLNAVNSDALFKLPYRVVFAIATLNSLYIYDTESSTPIAIFAGLHYAAITDVAWSSDARFLAVSSQDGYCTLVEFENGELGSPASLSEIPSHVASYLPQATAKMADFAPEKMDVDLSVGDEKVKRKDLKMETEEGVKTVQSRGPEKCKAIIEKEDNSVLLASSNGSSSNGKESTCGQKKQEDMQPVANLPKTSRSRITPIAVEGANSVMKKMDMDVSLADKDIMTKDLKMEMEEVAKSVQSTGPEKVENSVLVASSNSFISNGKESTCDQKKQEDMQPVANLPKPPRRRITPIAVEKP